MALHRGHGFELLPKSSRSVWVSWLAHKSLGLSIAAGMVALVVVAHYFVSERQAGHFEAIARETGSVAEFWGEVSPNHAGTALVYQQSVETGVGVFFSRLPNGQRRQLYELPEKYATKNRGALNLNIWGWATDDSLFAFSRLNGTNRLLIICNGQTGDLEREAKVNRQIKGVVWLGTDALAFVNDKDDLYYWAAGNDRRGSRVISFVRKGTGKPDVTVRSLVALAPDTRWHGRTDQPSGRGNLAPHLL